VRNDFEDGGGEGMGASDFLRGGAFTLVELLVVMAVVGILSVLGYSAYQRVIESGRATACTVYLRQLGMASGQFWVENNQTMPTLKTARGSVSDDLPVIDNTLDRYLSGGRDVFSCPADRRGLGERSGTSYLWNNTLNGQVLANLNFLGLVEDLSHIPILSDKEGFHPYMDNKVNILYADGHATKDLQFFTEEPSRK